MCRDPGDDCLLALAAKSQADLIVTGDLDLLDLSEFTPPIVTPRDLRYRQGSGSVGDLMHTVDELFADRMEGMDGFAAYHALDCGGGEILSISLFRDQSGAEESDDKALAFVREQLEEFDIERTEVLGGTVSVSRAMARLLEPAHA